MSIRKKTSDRQSRKRKVRPRPWIVRSRAWISLLIMAPFVALAVVSVPRVKEGSVADFVLDLLGWTCFAAGAVFRWWATLYIGGKKGRELAVDGPYSLCRNPLYLGTFLLTLSIAFYLHSVLLGFGVVLATPIYLGVTVPWEEQSLRQVFGERFENYRRKTPSFLPEFKRFHSPSSIDVNVDGLSAEFQRALRWMWIPVLAQSLEQLKHASWWPAWMILP